MSITHEIALIFVDIHGRHLSKPVVTSGHLMEVVVETANIPMQTDGEYAGCTPATIRSVANAISMRR